MKGTEVAKKLEKHNFGSKYPWANWTDGGVWEITEGLDFDIDPQVMRIALHNRATKQGLKVRTQMRVDRKGDHHITFQYWTPKRLDSKPRPKPKKRSDAIAIKFPGGR